MLLSRGEGYTHRGASFGVFPYGDAITAEVYYTESELCGYEHIDISTKIKENFILLVDRGGCSFVTKSRNAQMAGAVAVIIADDRCLCYGSGFCASDENIDCEAAEPLMTDDGSGNDIKILSLIVDKGEADPIKAELVKNGTVVIEISFELPTIDFVS